MDIGKFIESYEKKEGITVFADFNDDFYVEARDEIIAEAKIRRRINERKKQGIKS